MMSSAPESGKQSDAELNLASASPSPKKSGRSKKTGMRYVRLTTEDNSIVEGLYPEQKGAVKRQPGDLKFNNCYLVRDVGKVGRLWVARPTRSDDDFPNNLPVFKEISEVENDPKIPEAPVLSVENLKKWYPLKRGFFETVFAKSELNVKAVDGVSFHLSKGEIFALAGESGSGKTTLGKVVLRLVSPTSGHIYFLGMDITGFQDKDMKPLRREMQIVFQDPFESLDPRM